MGRDHTPADDVVAAIAADGGSAVANHDDVTDAAGASALVTQAVETFGRLDVLVNNAGILRDRTIVNMTEEEWDDVVAVHLRGHFLPLRHAARYWRAEAKANRPRRASVINTTSTSGLRSNPGQSNYGAAKSGIATLTEIANKELRPYGVRCNAVAPAARTRLTATVPGAAERDAQYRAEVEAGAFDRRDPANIAPFVAYLATEACPLDGKVFFVAGSRVALFQPWSIVDQIETDGRWTIEQLGVAAAPWGDVTFDRALVV